MKKLLIIISLLISTSLLAQMKLDISLAIPQTTYIECEPIPLIISWQNVSEKEMKIGIERTPTRSRAVSIWINGELALKMPPAWYGRGEPAISSKRTFDPGERISEEFDLLYLGLEPGEYRVKVVADFRDFPEGYFNGYVDSQDLKISIVKAAGEDLKVLDHFRNNPREETHMNVCVYINYSAYGMKDIREYFPTSTYAIVQYYLAFSKLNPVNKLISLELRRHYNRPDSEIDKYISSQINTLTSMENLHLIIANKPASVYSNVIRSEYAGRLSLFGKYEDAYNECQKVVKNGKDLSSVEKCGEFNSYLIEKKLYKIEKLPTIQKD